ncbi:MAG: VOC family protein [Oceanospirillaceae bacterium]|nr:VOC family protein [Oceanospirillaceae bacterium]
MELGAFSISLDVKDIQQSKAFYELLGFTVTGGDQAQNWLVMRNADTTIGLFQGMFEGNILTFNPGWGNKCQALGSFTDVRELHKNFKLKGINITSESIESDAGPAHFTLTDPDGNSILVDQHV